MAARYVARDVSDVFAVSAEDDLIVVPNSGPNRTRFVRHKSSTLWGREGDGPYPSPRSVALVDTSLYVLTDYGFNWEWDWAWLTYQKPSRTFETGIGGVSYDPSLLARGRLRFRSAHRRLFWRRSSALRTPLHSSSFPR